MLGEYRVLTGPTAGGKTSWLVQRGRQRPLLALSADSRQIYRHMDIGTGKASAAEQQVAPHRLLDILDPPHSFSVYQYVIRAAQVLQELEADPQNAGREIWFIGGTGLYLRAVMADLELGLAPRTRLRTVLQDRLKYMGARVVSESLGLELKEPDNPARVQRAAEQACADPATALKIYLRCGLTHADYEADEAEMSSEPGEELWESSRAVLRRWSCRGCYVLDPGRDELLRNIEMRVSAMFAHGLADEVRRLRGMGYGECSVVSDGIGYREAAAVLDNRAAAQDAIQQTIVRTRQYAKRQRTYFRGQQWQFYTAAQLDAQLNADIRQAAD
ncbi:hypothetical protein IT575_10710 [bacterium]|nr:hypothetical protein [bacterium]